MAALGKTVADPDGGLAQLIGLHALELGNHRRHAAHVQGLGSKAFGLGLAFGLADLPELALELLDPGDGLTNPLGRVRRLAAADRLGNLLKEAPLEVHVPKGVGTRERLRPPEARADASLPQQTDQRDLARVPHVRPTAQLDRVVTHLDHPHDVAVLLAEQGDRSARTPG